MAAYSVHTATRLLPKTRYSASILLTPAGCEARCARYSALLSPRGAPAWPSLSDTSLRPSESASSCDGDAGDAAPERLSGRGPSASRLARGLCVPLASTCDAMLRMEAGGEGAGSGVWRWGERRLGPAAGMA